MRATDKISWIDQLEVTGPIKGIMTFIDELASTYDRRVAAMHADYQRDVEEILACYKKERQDFHELLEQQKNTIEQLQQELKTIQQNYKTLNIEYNLTKENLETNKQELIELTKALQTEQDLIALTNQKIAAIRQQLELTDDANLEEEPISVVTNVPESSIVNFADDLDPNISIPQGKKRRFARTKEFFKQVIADRLTRPIILRNKPAAIISDDEEQDTFYY